MSRSRREKVFKSSFEVHGGRWQGLDKTRTFTLDVRVKVVEARVTVIDVRLKVVVVRVTFADTMQYGMEMEGYGS